MNIRTDAAGAVSKAHILSRGFRIYYVESVNDMGQCTVELPYYTNDIYKIVGGWWTYFVLDLHDRECFSGWWNSNDEFDQTFRELGMSF